jgi:rare lipoprotein A
MTNRSGSPCRGATGRAVLSFTLALGLALLAGCGGRGPALPDDRDGPGKAIDFSSIPDAVPRAEPLSRGGNMASYVVFGKRYHTLQSSAGFVERGIASWYGSKFHGRNTSNGEVFDMYAMTAAHKHLPLPTFVEVVNLENGRRVVVRVNDRGPFHENRVIDLSYAAAGRLGMLGKGTALVEVRAIDPGRKAPTTRLAAGPGAQPVAAAPRIYLQAGAFSSGDNAERLRERLERELARAVRVIRAEAAAGAMHRVQVGPLASVEIADQVTTQMHRAGIQTPLVVID